MSSNQRSWKNILLDGPSQLFLTLAIVAAIATLLFLLGQQLWGNLEAGGSLAEDALANCPQLVDEKPSNGRVKIMEEDNSLDKQVREMALACHDKRAKQIGALTSHRKQTKLFLIGAFIFSVVLFMVMGLRMTHKLAGPIFKMRLYASSWQKPHASKAYSLRKHDHLKQFYESFKEAHERIEADNQKRVAVLKQIQREGVNSPLVTKYLEKREGGPS